MAQVSSGEVVNLFKKVYGNLTDLQPEDFELQKDIPFSQKQKVGESYSEAVVLTAEAGVTLGGNALEAFDINPAVAGSVQQILVKPSMSVIPSIVPWGVLSRSAGGGEKAFYDGTKYIVKNNLKSHNRLLEILRLYGQAPDLLGYVSYATATYRGVAFTNGSGTLNGVTFTNGVSAASKAILLAPGQFASGIWVGFEGIQVQQVDSNNLVVAQGKLKTVESEYGYITVDFTPTAASAVSGAGSIRLCFEGMAEGKDAVGVKKILSTTTGSVFDVSVTKYSLWHGVQRDNGGLKLKLSDLQTVAAQSVNRGGLDGDWNVYVNPRSWASMNTTEAGTRNYDASYTESEFKNGAKAIKYFSQNGSMTIKAHRMVKEGDAFCLHMPDWSRSGSAEVSFTIPGIEKEVIFPLEGQAGYAFRSFSDQYIFCHALARSAIITGINDESST